MAAIRLEWIYSTPAIVALIGLCADKFADEQDKAAVVKWILLRFQSNVQYNRNVVVDVFINRIFIKIFGNKILSLKFFIRSFVLSIFFIALTALISDPSLFRYSELTKNFYVLFPILVVTIIADTLSNLVTYSLIKQSTNGKNVIDFVVVIFSDFALTITIFTLLLPLGLSASILYKIGLDNKGEISISSYGPPEETKFSVKSLSSILSEVKDSRIKTYAMIVHNENGNVDGNDIILFADSSENYESFINKLSGKFINEGFYLDQSGFSLTIDSVSIKRYSTHIEIKMKVSKSQEKFIFENILILYSSAFSDAESVRLKFFEVLRFQPLMIDISHIMRRAGVFRFSKLNVPSLYCSNRPNDQYVHKYDKDLLENCQEFLFSVPEVRSHIAFFLSKNSIESANVSITPFALSSIATSILYYLIIIVIIFGYLSINLTNRFFNGFLSGQIKSFHRRPFLVLSLYSLVIIFPSVFILNIIF